MGVPEPELIHYNAKEFDFGKDKAFPMRDQHFFASVDKVRRGGEGGWLEGGGGAGGVRGAVRRLSCSVHAASRQDLRRRSRAHLRYPVLLVVPTACHRVNARKPHNPRNPHRLHFLTAPSISSHPPPHLASPATPPP